MLKNILFLYKIALTVNRVLRLRLWPHILCSSLNSLHHHLNLILHIAEDIDRLQWLFSKFITTR